MNGIFGPSVVTASRLFSVSTLNFCSPAKYIAIARGSLAALASTPAGSADAFQGKKQVAPREAQATIVRNAVCAMEFRAAHVGSCVLTGHSPRWI